MNKILKLTLSDHSPVSRKIVAFTEVNTFPEKVTVLNNVAVIIRENEFLTDSVNETKEEEFVINASDDGHFIELGEEAYFSFRKLIKMNNAFLYDFCGELPNLGTGQYIKK
jgi:hypothetical protein